VGTAEETAEETAGFESTIHTPLAIVVLNTDKRSFTSKKNKGEIQSFVIMILKREREKRRRVTLLCCNFLDSVLTVMFAH